MAAENFVKILSDIESNSPWSTKTLVLSNIVNSDDMGLLSHALQKNTVVHTLDIMIDDYLLTGNAIKSLGDLFRNNKYITKFTLHNRRSDKKDYLTPAVITELVDALKSNSTVTELYLDHNGIDNEGAALLGELLDHNPTLKILDLHGNNIGGPGASALAAGMHSNHVLTKLALNHNDINDEGSDAFAKLFRENKDRESKTKAEVSLHGNSLISDKAITDLSDAIIAGNNTYMQHAPLHHPTLTKALEEFCAKNRGVSHTDRARQWRNSQIGF